MVLNLFSFFAQCRTLRHYIIDQNWWYITSKFWSPYQRKILRCMSWGCRRTNFKFLFLFPWPISCYWHFTKPFPYSKKNLNSRQIFHYQKIFSIYLYQNRYVLNKNIWKGSHPNGMWLNAVEYWTFLLRSKYKCPCRHFCWL